LKICADENDIYIEAIRLGLILSIISDAILSSFLEKKNFFGDLPQRMEKIEFTRRIFCHKGAKAQSSTKGFHAKLAREQRRDKPHPQPLS